MKINNEYDIGQKVYLITDPEQFERMVVQIIICPGNIIQYTLSCGENASTHDAIEISETKQVI